MHYFGRVPVMVEAHMNFAEFLRDNQSDIIQYVGNITRKAPAGSDVFGKLVNDVLRLEFPIKKGKVPYVLDRVHIELGWAILEAMWLGCLAQQKVKRKLYPEKCATLFKDMIDFAFEVGCNYGETRP